MICMASCIASAVMIKKEKVNIESGKEGVCVCVCCDNIYDSRGVVDSWRIQTTAFRVGMAVYWSSLGGRAVKRECRVIISRIR